LSQLELAGDAYTNSYVSYLESGRRAPTAEVADYLANRLGTTPAALGFTGDGSTELDSRIAHELMVGDKAVSRHEWAAALAAAGRALELAERSPRGERRWESLHLRCRTLLESGDFEAAATLARKLAAVEVAALSPFLRAEALTLEARSLRGSGRLSEAAVAAEEALTISGIDSTLEVEALLQLVAAKAELGADAATLDPYAARLRALSRTLEPGHTKGRVLWTLGNVAFLAGDSEGGEAAHGEAAGMILAPVDLALFGRLHRVIGHYRLRRGVTTGVAAELAIARQASELVAREADLVELLVEEARLDHAEERHAAALEKLDRALSSDVMAIPFVGRAETHELMGLVLSALGRSAEATASFRQAAVDFETMQALPRALAAWRLAADEKVGSVS
jgi:tetratricopeptide (TPR) repeat protein